MVKPLFFLVSSKINRVNKLWSVTCEILSYYLTIFLNFVIKTVFEI